MISSRLARIGIFLVSAVVLYGLGPIVAKEWSGFDACPSLGPLPACYLVFAGYSAIAFSVLLEPLRSGWIFFAGWFPVFLLALVGTSLELMGRHTCPQTDAGIPLCFFSLAFAIVLAGAFLLARRLSARAELAS